jgi:thiamine pyrophosphokinase
MSEAAGEQGSIGAVLMANGDFPPAALPYLHRELSTGATLVGVDGGTRHLLQHGLLPAYVTGDFDSLTEFERADLQTQGVQIVPTPNQDYTDLDKAITFARETLGARNIRVFGASAGRLDHVYSNLSVLLKHGRDCDVRLVDDWGETRVVNRTLSLTESDLPGRTLSLLAFGTVPSVTTTGVEWPLTNETLAPGVRDGTLNRVTDATITVVSPHGDLLVTLQHPFSH